MHDFDEQWNAYIDGELSAAEAETFEQSLDEAGRERLQQEKAIEDALAERLAESVSCPDDFWAAIQAKVQALDASEANSGNVVAFEPRARRPMWYAASVAAAVLVAFTLATLFQNRPAADNEAVVMAAASIEELVAGSEVEGGRENVERFLRERGIDLALVEEETIPMASIHHDVHIVGAREERIEGKPVKEVLFACCGYPVKLLTAKRGTPEAAALIAAAERDDNDIQEVREVGGYVTAAVGHHHAPDLLDIFGK